MTGGEHETRLRVLLKFKQDDDAVLCLAGQKGGETYSREQISHVGIDCKIISYIY
jgi:hypothetical protein